MTGTCQLGDFWGPPGSERSFVVMLLGSGELGKEVAIEFQRLGVEVVACDRYSGAPAMQVAHRSHVFDMSDGSSLRSIVEAERPDLIVPEIEAIATHELVKLEQEGFRVTPTARAARLTMDREGIRKLAAEELQLPTSDYEFADDLTAVEQAVERLGLPCIIKPVMSSSGKGQSLVRNRGDVASAYELAATAGRVGGNRVIVEGFVDFDYEITLLTIQHCDGISFCEPIGHVQHDGDYRESWQPMAMDPEVLRQAQEIAAAVTTELGGYGLFGVELFVRGDSVLFSEVSPRPHDTGLVTMASQDLSEFALHVRAVLGFPVTAIRQFGPTASTAVVLTGDSDLPIVTGLSSAFAVPTSRALLFGKPVIHGERRMGVTLASGTTITQARERALAAAAHLGLAD